MKSGGGQEDQKPGTGRVACTLAQSASRPQRKTARPVPTGSGSNSLLPRRIPRQLLDENSAASTPDDLADSSGHIRSWNALHFAGLNVGNPSPCLGLPAFLDSRTEMKPLGQPVHQLHDLLSWQVAGLFNNLIKRQRHGINLPTSEPKLKREAESLRAHSSRGP